MSLKKPARQLTLCDESAPELLWVDLPAVRNLLTIIPFQGAWKECRGVDVPSPSLYPDSAPLLHPQTPPPSK